MRRIFFRLLVWISVAFLLGCDDHADAPDVNGSSGDGSESSAHAPVEKIDLNSATTSELETLPGIGDVMAQRIIESRPYSSVEDVLRVNGLGERTLENIRDLVVAKD